MKVPAFTIPVSIPYRYYKNGTGYTPTTWEAELFQFLIGTIKTYTSHVAFLNCLKFQFLIGTIKTQIQTVTSKVFDGFNSL